MANTPLNDVIIAGAGSVGLFLASELTLASRFVIVLERDVSSESPGKKAPLGVRGMNQLSVEMLYRRGLLDQFLALAPTQGAKGGPTRTHGQGGAKLNGRFLGHFAGIFLEADKLEPARWEYGFRGPAQKPMPTYLEQVETILSAHAVAQGAEIRRGTGFTRIVAEDADGIAVEAGDAGETFRGRYLVGCDGGRSAVRHAAGFNFPGTDPKYTACAVQCDVDHPDKLAVGAHVTATGKYYVVKPNVLHLIDFDDAAFDRTQVITRDHLQSVLERVTGLEDVAITTVHRVFSYTDRCKQASEYKRGRVLLAGDAAHIHSPLGARGMNLGLGDAMNLGWKLAATVRREEKDETASAVASPAPSSLLDSYERERHPIGAWALRWTQAQVATLQPGPYGAAIRAVVQDPIDTKDGTNLMVDRLWGLSRKYDLEGAENAHRLVGRSAPDVLMDDGERLGLKMHQGRGVLVVADANEEALRRLVQGELGDHIVWVKLGTEDACGLQAMVVRPDGIVA